MMDKRPSITQQSCAGLPQAIAEMAAILARQFHPRRIILFGSWARGTATPDSDVDLMVVVDTLEDRRRQRIAMRRALDDTGMPKDIILVSAAEFARKADVPGSIVFPAVREGRVLYAA